MSDTTNINDGGPAFPVREAERFNPKNNETHTIEQHWGMTLRDFFAAHAMSFCFENYAISRRHDEQRPDAVDLSPEDTTDCEIIAEYAYAMADAMLAERNHGSRERAAAIRRAEGTP